MGAEPWSCIVPFQDDYPKSLEAAQAQEFAAGRYRVLDPIRPPATIEEARIRAGESGTCSVLDMFGVIDTPHEVINEQYAGTEIHFAGYSFD